MSKIQEWEQKIKIKRSKTSFKEAVKEVASWMPVVLYRAKEGYLSRYPNTPRMTHRVSPEAYYKSIDEYSKRGIEYDFKKTFFENYSLLLEKVPVLGRMTLINTENSEFAESIVNVKNIYLSYIIINGCENVFYTFYAQDHSKDIFNSVMVWDHSQVVYF